MKKYEEWLKRQLHEDDLGEDGYSELCSILHGIPFLPTVEMDWNRNDDGLNLGGEWVEENCRSEADILGAMADLAKGHPNGMCTMLELMVVLSRYIHYELLGGPFERDISWWFEEMLRNVGLEDYRDGYIEGLGHDEATNEIAEICGRVIFRQYGWDGEGGFFPLMNPGEDQREEELITQMNNYIAENYDIV